MKKLLPVALISLMFSSMTFAGSCPMMAKNLDAKIAEAQELRDAGMKAAYEKRSTSFSSDESSRDGHYIPIEV